MLTAHIKMKNKKGQFMIGLIFFGVIVVLVLALVFKGKLLELFQGFMELTKSRTFWIVVILSLVIAFRKFVQEVLMWILKILKGVLKI
jgi:hypothetical protein